jgi:hypothetical protein
VALGKMLNLGGMENSVPKTTQNPNRFRVARNVQPSIDGRIIPRSSYETPNGQPTEILRYEHLTQYNENIFKVAFKRVFSSPLLGWHVFYNGSAQIPFCVLGGDQAAPTGNWSITPMSLRKNNTPYYLDPRLGNLYKYDGVEVTKAGVDQPYFSCAQYASAGATWIKVIKHSLDFDNNEPVSETVTFPCTPTASAIVIRTDLSATSIVSLSNPNVSPESRIIDNSLFFTPDPTFVGTLTYSALTNDFGVLALSTNISVFDSMAVGSYIFLRKSDANNNIIPWTNLNNSKDYKIIAVKIKSLSPFTLDALNVKGIQVSSFEWETFNFSGTDFTNITTNCVGGFKKMYSVWASPTKTGNYVLRGIGPEEYLNTTRTFTVNLSSTTVPLYSTAESLPITVGLNLGDWYAVNSKKLQIQFNNYFTNSFYGMTSYQDQLLWWTEDLIYFSDPTLGGTVENTSASAFIRVGDSEYGKIISCCGTQDYLIVSRERKNYFINGNLATGNYRVQDIPDIEIGAWCNNGTINAIGSVILINSTGVWKIEGGGKVTFLSKQIPKNFSIYDPFNSTEDVVFKLNGFSSIPLGPIPYTDTGLEIVFDEFREYLIFCQRSSNTIPILVFHTKTGEFYEWNGFEELGIRGMTCFKGVIYYGTIDEVNFLAKIKNEMPLSTTQDYANTYPIQLYSTWLTANEPSLEKQLLQLKMFGSINNNGQDSINVVHFKDWNLFKVTNSTYLPDYVGQYSHLKRLNSDKVLSSSVGFEIIENDVTFSLESMEIEFNPIQQGVKR